MIAWRVLRMRKYRYSVRVREIFIVLLISGMAACGAEIGWQPFGHSTGLERPIAAESSPAVGVLEESEPPLLDGTYSLISSNCSRIGITLTPQLELSHTEKEDSVTDAVAYSTNVGPSLWALPDGRITFCGRSDGQNCFNSCGGHVEGNHLVILCTEFALPARTCELSYERNS